MEDIEAKLRERERQLFGKKSERGSGSEQSEGAKEGERSKARRDRPPSSSLQSPYGLLPC